MYSQTWSMRFRREGERDASWRASSRDRLACIHSLSSCMSRTSALKGKCVCISGGTGANSIVDAFAVFETTSFVIPISDDGGSSSEVQRVLGGPSIGDIRSRLIRLIPETAPDTPLAAIRRLLEYRLGDSNSAAVKAEWHSIVEGRHKLWRGVPSDRKECIRAFLIHVEAAILRKASKVRPLQTFRQKVS